MIYDMILVGSGNGACGFLSQYLQTVHLGCIAVLEEGEDFFNTSEITHQNNWTESYAEGNVFKLHQALTPKGTPIISGRACTMGGGGSINYTMIHESSEWLAQHIGHSVEYWQTLKAELNQKFHRQDPAKKLSSVTQHILLTAERFGFVPSQNAIEHIPNYVEGDSKLLHLFPTQFNQFGQRTNSGVSLVDWCDQRIHLKTRCKVLKLEFAEEQARCQGVLVQYLDTGNIEHLHLAEQGKLILCAGGATPQLLWPHRELLQNYQIGQHVSDHIVLPLGIYLLDQNIEVLPRDVYVPIFATTTWKPVQQGEATVCCFDFFSGDFERLWFLISHLYLAFLLPNWLKRIVLRVPWLFYVMKNLIRMLIQLINFMTNLWWGCSRLVQGKSWHQNVNLVTAIVKYNPAIEGCYEDDGSQIRLNFFTADAKSQFNQDQELAKSVITAQLAMLNSLGKQPSRLFQFIYRLFTKIPYEEKQVEKYIDVYSRKFLLSEQHLSGGCLFGKAIDKGIDHPQKTGKLYGSANVYVADLSSVPLPRISPQMTAYLIGFHVAKQLTTDS